MSVPLLVEQVIALLEVKLEVVSAWVHALVNRIELLAERPRRERHWNARFSEEGVSIDSSFLETAETL